MPPRTEGVDARNMVSGRRVPAPSARLLNPDNDAEQLGVHKTAADAARLQAAAAGSEPKDLFNPDSPAAQSPPPSESERGRSSARSDQSDYPPTDDRSSSPPARGGRSQSSDTDDEEDAAAVPRASGSKRKRTRRSSSVISVESTDADGLLKDIPVVIIIDDDERTMAQRRRDINNFFEAVDSRTSKNRICKICTTKGAAKTDQKTYQGYKPQPVRGSLTRKLHILDKGLTAGTAWARLNIGSEATLGFYFTKG
ncbi:hypothetical protein C8F04DRAFT_1202272 [Mycena alexandri]|uniref:Uncharacterized protein n=1 Tax=Mycena alexandri TaxID=1745969 RepID=A0AAD6S038_9AGAR|nr:hypothetical protein C8F04DRAFT_1202272 [Mycena alexandri]